jgi:hypothetical protein
MHQCLKRHITVTESRFAAEHVTVVYHGMWLYSEQCRLAVMVTKMSNDDVKCGVLICNQKVYNLSQNENLEHNLSSGDWLPISVLLHVIITILTIKYRQIVSTKFQRFKIVYLCTVGCRLTTLLLFLIVYWSISFYFIVTKIVFSHAGLAAVRLKFPYIIDLNWELTL